jgi:hypothetical protein
MDVNPRQSKAGPTWRRTGEAAQIRRLYCRSAGPEVQCRAGWSVPRPARQRACRSGADRAKTGGRTAKKAPIFS